MWSEDTAAGLGGAAGFLQEVQLRLRLRQWRSNGPEDKTAKARPGGGTSTAVRRQARWGAPCTGAGCTQPLPRPCHRPSLQDVPAPCPGQILGAHKQEHLYTGGQA